MDSRVQKKADVGLGHSLVDGFISVEGRHCRSINTIRLDELTHSSILSVLESRSYSSGRERSNEKNLQWDCEKLQGSNRTGEGFQGRKCSFRSWVDPSARPVKSVLHWLCKVERVGVVSGSLRAFHGELRIPQLLAKVICNLSCKLARKCASRRSQR